MVSLGHQSLPPTDLGRVDEKTASPRGRPLHKEHRKLYVKVRDDQGCKLYLVLPILMLYNYGYFLNWKKVNQNFIWQQDGISQTAMAGSDVVNLDVQFSMTFSNICGRISATTNVVFQMVKRLWLIRIDQ
ncbi:hypothetical protein TNCV_517951 [Trichonephila clavipes]|nr:hypothetical protein TNCV_517951 [Trichonephila clavipes]